MNLNKKEKEVLIHLLTDEINKNFYNIEAKKLLEKIKITDEKMVRDKIKAKQLIDIFYDIGIYSTKDPKQITSEEMEKSVEYMVLTKKYKEINKNFINLMQESSSFNSETLKFLIYKHNKEMLSIGSKASDLISKDS